MMAGRELDALAAEHVMGFRREGQPRDYDGLHGGEPVLLPPGKTWDSLEPILPRKGCMSLGYFVPRYSTDLHEAWKLAEYVMRKVPAPLQIVAYSYARTYAKISVDFDADSGWSEANGEHATPHAICLAALAAVGAEVPD